MQAIKVVNIKCGGCEAGIVSALNMAGMKDVKVSVESQEVSFEGDRDKAVNVLRKLGYPEANTEEAKSLLKKAKSYVTCMIGRTKK